MVTTTYRVAAKGSSRAKKAWPQFNQGKIISTGKHKNG